MGAQLLLQLVEGAREPRRARARADPEHARRGLAVEVEHDPERDRLALAGRQGAEGALERGGEALREPRLLGLPQPARVDLLAPRPATLRAEVVERDRP